MNDDAYKKISAPIQSYTEMLDHRVQGNVSPDEIKRFTVELFTPYFTDLKTLDDLAVSDLLPDTIAFLVLLKERWPVVLFQHALETHRTAYIRDPDACLQLCADMVLPLERGLALYDSQLVLSRGATTLALEEFALERLRHSGAIIEGSLKPVLQELVGHMHISNGQHAVTDELLGLDLGILIDELIRASGYPGFFAPLPWGIKLSQWRNIAQHLSVDTQTDHIICSYGRIPHVKSVTLARDDLDKILHLSCLTYSSLNLAQSLFYLDHLVEFRARGMMPTSFTVRKEAELYHFTAELATQGFELAECKLLDNQAIAVVRDVTTLDPQVRRLHAMQFAMPLWVHTKAAALTVRYLERSGTPSLEIHIPGLVCERIARGEAELATFAREAELIDLAGSEKVQFDVLLVWPPAPTTKHHT